MGRTIFFLLIILSLAIVAGPLSAEEGGTGIPVFVSILPQAYFVERVGGRHVDVEVLVGEGQSPHTYEPSPQQLARLSSARAYFTIGVPFEANLLKKIRRSHKNLLIIETQKGIAYRYSGDHSHGHSAKGTAGSHSAIPDPHIWMNPRLVKVQARNIYDALCVLDPANAESYSKNLQAFSSDLDLVDRQIVAALAPLKGSNLYVFHSAFGYFADAYGLHQVPVEIEGKEPGAKQLARLIDRAKKDGVRVIFVQPQFSTKSAEAAAKGIGGAVVPINPLARDYLVNLRRIAAAVAQGLRRENP